VFYINEIAQALNTHFSRIGTKLAAKLKEIAPTYNQQFRKDFPICLLAMERQ